VQMMRRRTSEVPCTHAYMQMLTAPYAPALLTCQSSLRLMQCQHRIGSIYTDYAGASSDPHALRRSLRCTRSVEEQEDARRHEDGDDSIDVEPDWSRYTSEASAIIVHHDSILRNKRLLFTYM
jgi:hypothetical protein